MTNHHHTDTDTAANDPLVLSSVEIDKLLSMRLIANLATLNEDGSFHLMPMPIPISKCSLTKFD